MNKKDEIYANYWLKTGGHFEHEVGGKAKLEAGERIDERTKLYELGVNDVLTIKGPAGTIILDSSQITLKGAVTVKGSLSITGGSPDMVEALNMRFNEGKPICIPCGCGED